MRLRNWKETREPTIDETLADVHPRTLEESFHFYAEIHSLVWVKPADGKWRHGVVLADECYRLSPEGRPDRCFSVRYGTRQKRLETFAPWDGVMKPDTPEVRELLRQAGYYV